MIKFLGMTTDPVVVKKLQFILIRLLRDKKITQHVKMTFIKQFWTLEKSDLHTDQISRDDHRPS